MKPYIFKTYSGKFPSYEIFRIKIDSCIKHFHHGIFSRQMRPCKSLLVSCGLSSAWCAVTHCLQTHKMMEIQRLMTLATHSDINLPWYKVLSHSYPHWILLHITCRLLSLSVTHISSACVYREAPNVNGGCYIINPKETRFRIWSRENAFCSLIFATYIQGLLIVMPKKYF